MQLFLSFFFTSFIKGQESIGDKPLFLNFYYLDLEKWRKTFYPQHTAEEKLLNDSSTKSYLLKNEYTNKY